MSASRRSLRQPGPVSTERWLSAEGTLREVAFELEPGLTVNEAIARPVRTAGIRGGTVELSGGAFGPFTYVMPALSFDAAHAAFYSDSRTPLGRTAFERGAATFGERDGVPFVHCHGVWRETDGELRGGHVMPLDTVVAEPIRARAYGTAEAAFAVLPDAETNFALFTPVGEGAVAPGGRAAVLLKVGPNEPLDAAILAACRRHGLADARIHGIGSIVGAIFADGRDVPSVATELFFERGRVVLGPDGRGKAEIDIALVDVEGQIHEGRLAPGNPVCITCELTLVAAVPQREDAR